jgi:GrpB-like predicted nucleotidyltransferase (UPF0157 family)
MGGADRQPLELSLGLPPGAVRLDSHHAGWAGAFAEEANSLLRASAGLLLSIEHIGSTCVPGLKAKPIIDMAAAIVSFDRISSLRRHLEPLGYEYLGDGIVSEHHIFAKGASRTHLLHVVEHGRRRWRELLAFRDLLKSDASIAAEYEATKIELARRFAADRRAYREAKKDFVDPIVATLVRAD